MNPDLVIGPGDRGNSGRNPPRSPASGRRTSRLAASLLAESPPPMHSSLLLLLCCLAMTQGTLPAQVARVDPYTIVGDRNYLSGYPAMNDDGSIQVVVEIPAGSAQKWEVDKRDGTLRWEFKDSQPRVVKYLAYPGNYGMIPRTLLARDEGGDGDPLDVLILGEAMERGSVVRARVIGVLQLLDGGEVDDKILAVPMQAPLAMVDDLEELRAKFPGVLEIVETWFTNYKGPGKMESKGYAGVERAVAVIHKAAARFEATQNR